MARLTTPEWFPLASGEYLSVQSMLDRQKTHEIKSWDFDDFVNFLLKPYLCGWWVFPARIIAYDTEARLPSDDMPAWLDSLWPEYLTQRFDPERKPRGIEFPWTRPDPGQIKGWTVPPPVA